MTDISTADRRLPRFPSGDVVVEECEERYRLVAGRAFAPGDAVLALEGRIQASRDRYSIQVGVDAHLSVPPDASFAETVARHPWRFLNHACDPNAALVEWEFVARRPIAPDDEITFDYHTTEWELVSPFPCECGSAACVGEVRGHRFLDDAARAHRVSPVALHLEVLRERRARDP